MRKPDRLKYGVDERPPTSEFAVLALQHAVLALMFMIYPVAAAQAIGFSAEQTGALVCGCIAAVAVATLLQYLRPPWGSGALAIQLPSPVMLPSMVLAGLSGGLSLIAGMTIVLGVSELLLSRVMRHLRAFFPPEVCGVVVLMLGVAIATPALQSFTGAQPGAEGHGLQADARTLSVAGATLMTILAAAVFGRGPIKLFALGGGMLVGVVMSAMLGFIAPQAVDGLRDAPWVGLPNLHLVQPQFDLALIPLFVLMAAVNSVDNLGVLVGIQRMVNADWKKIDMTQGAGGIQANAVGNLVAGAVGGIPVGLSSANVGLTFATGAATRLVSLAVAGILFLALFTPKVVAALALIPRPVIGALMVYTASYMMVAGMELVQSRMLSERRMFTVGLSVLLGLSPLILPGIYDGLPGMLAPIFHSTLAIAALSALLLNMVFQIGVAQNASASVGEELSTYETIREFLEKQGGLWGARHDVVTRAINASSEALETLLAAGVATHQIKLDARYDEVNLDVVLSYQGEALEFPTERPDIEDLLADERSQLRVAGYIIRRSVDRLSHRTEGGWNRLGLHFEH